jgi:hypothetical protein
VCVQPWGAVGRVCKRGQTVSGGSAVVCDSGRKRWTDEGPGRSGVGHSLRDVVKGSRGGIEAKEGGRGGADARAVAPPSPQ